MLWKSSAETHLPKDEILSMDSITSLAVLPDDLLQIAYHLIYGNFHWEDIRVTLKETPYFNSAVVSHQDMSNECHILPQIEPGIYNIM
jgi:hypothetical protein